MYGAPQKLEAGQNQNAKDPTANGPAKTQTGNGKPPAPTPKEESGPAIGGSTKSKWSKLAGNGSLNIPKDGDTASVKSGSIGSERRGSKLSLGSQQSGLDLNKILAQQTQQKEEAESENTRNAQVSNDSYLRSSIPYLPQWVAIICLIMNIIIPGSGTICSGLCIFCCGKPRVATKGDQIMETFCVSLWVGAIQLCTVTFFLVGWFWSFTWGIYMIILSVDYRKMQKKAKETKPKTNNGYVAFQ